MSGASLVVVVAAGVTALATLGGCVAAPIFLLAAGQVGAEMALGVAIEAARATGSRESEEAVSQRTAKLEAERRDRETELRGLAMAGDMTAAAELAERTGDMEPLKHLAERGDGEAAYLYARISKDLGPLLASAEAGDVQAADRYARLSGDSGPLKKLAERGDLKAADAYADRTSDLVPLKAISDAGKVEAAYLVYIQLAKREEAAAMAEGWTWLCRAADAGHRTAQREVAYWHRSDVWQMSPVHYPKLRTIADAGVGPDDRIAYAWYAKAAQQGDEEAEHLMRSVGQVMTAQELTAVEDLEQRAEFNRCPRTVRH